MLSVFKRCLVAVLDYITSCGRLVAGMEHHWDTANNVDVGDRAETFRPDGNARIAS